jgi:hypothetical protein
MVISWLAVGLKQQLEPIGNNISSKKITANKIRSGPFCRSMSPLDPDPEEDSTLAAVLYIEPIVAPPEINVELKAPDWVFHMLTSKGMPPPVETIGGRTLDTEEKSTIATFSSKSQKSILVTFSDSVENDVDVPGIVTPKLPNSELIFQISKEQFDSVADVQFVIRHPISQQGTVAVMQAAHDSKSIAPTDMATWTVSDGGVFFRLLGTKNGRPIAFMSADHPVDLKCRVVTKIFTWAQLPTSPRQNFGAMVLQLGPTTEIELIEEAAQ